MNTLSLRIRKARTQSRISQAELARRVGVMRGAVTQWEQPSGTHPSLEHLIQIALQTGVRFEWLATGRGPSRGDDADPVPAVIVEDYAADEYESKALACFRRLPASRRKVVLEILEALAR